MDEVLDVVHLPHAMWEDVSTIELGRGQVRVHTKLDRLNERYPVLVNPLQHHVLPHRMDTVIGVEAAF